MSSPHFRPAKNTHYAYYSGPEGIREPMALFDLQAASIEDRRRLIHKLVGEEGLLLAACPAWLEVETLEELSHALNSIDDPRR